MILHTHARTHACTHTHNMLVLIIEGGFLLCYKWTFSHPGKSGAATIRHIFWAFVSRILYCGTFLVLRVRPRGWRHYSNHAPLGLLAQWRENEWWGVWYCHFHSFPKLSSLAGYRLQYFDGELYRRNHFRHSVNLRHSFFASLTNAAIFEHLQYDTYPCAAWKSLAA